MKKLIKMLIIGTLLMFLLYGCAGSCGSDDANGGSNGSDTANGDGKIEITGSIDLQNSGVILDSLTEYQRSQIITRSDMSNYESIQIALESDILSPIPIPSTLTSAGTFKIKKNYKSSIAMNDYVVVACVVVEDEIIKAVLVKEDGSFVINPDIPTNDSFSFYFVLPYKDSSSFGGAFFQIKSNAGHNEFTLKSTEKIDIGILSAIIVGDKPIISSESVDLADLATGEPEKYSPQTSWSMDGHGLEFDLQFNEIDTGDDQIIIEPVTTLEVRTQNITFENGYARCDKPASNKPDTMIDIRDGFSKIENKQSNEMTVAVWVRYDDDSYKTDTKNLVLEKMGTIVVSLDCNTDSQCYFHGSTYCGIGDGTDMLTADSSSSDTGVYTNPNEWYFVVATVKIDLSEQLPEFKLFVNGKLMIKDKCPAGNTQSFINILMNGETRGALLCGGTDSILATPEFLRATFGELAIFSSALTLEEIILYYNATLL